MGAPFPPEARLRYQTLVMARFLGAQIVRTFTLRTSEGFVENFGPDIIAETTLSLLWHPRLDADQAHRWLRTDLLDICGAPP